MKSLALIMSLFFSIAAFAQTPATTAVGSIISAGIHTGTNFYGKCSVSVSLSSDSIAVSVADANGSDSFALSNESSDTYYLTADEANFFAYRLINSPHYSGMKNLGVMKEAEAVKVHIVTTFLGHDGEETPTYTECTISK